MLHSLHPDIDSGEEQDTDEPLGYPLDEEDEEEGEGIALGSKGDWAELLSPMRVRNRQKVVLHSSRWRRRALGKQSSVDRLVPGVSAPVVHVHANPVFVRHTTKPRVSQRRVLGVVRPCGPSPRHRLGGDTTGTHRDKAMPPTLPPSASPNTTVPTIPGCCSISRGVVATATAGCRPPATTCVAWGKPNLPATATVDEMYVRMRGARVG